MILDKIKGKFTYTRFIGFGFIAIILIGAILLSCPFSSREGEWTPFVDSLFTSTSATCVTGLVVYDTYTHWSTVGQVIILLMIQVGGIGFMTVASLVSMAFKKQIGIKERHLLMQSAGNTEMGGILGLIKRMALLTFTFEGAGALVLSFTFCKEMGFFRGVCNAVFHSVSAFCNAGFDLMGRYEQFSSLTRYYDSWAVLLPIALLIIFGATGFLVYNDLWTAKFNVKKVHLHTKIVLVVTAFLLVFGTILIFIMEQNYTLKGLPLDKQILLSFFQAVTPRTAGFNAVDLGQMSEGSSFLTIVYMFIGGNPGGTAGGVKTTTVFVLVMAVVAVIRHSNGVNVFKRRIDESTVRQAGAIATVYMLMFSVATISLLIIEPISIKEALFEVVSAGGTVGLSLSLTPSLQVASKIIIMLLMYSGRVGILSLIFMFAEKIHGTETNRPTEKILIG